MKFQDLGVRYVRDGLAMLRVKSNPKKGQYVCEDGIYRFSRSDNRRVVRIINSRANVVREVRKRINLS